MHVRAFFALLGVASASVMDSLTGIPDGWKSLGNAPADQKIHLRIAMSARHPELLEQTLYDISDPSSPRYGRYLKRDELKSMMRPHSEATTAVFRWLSQSGVHLDAIAEDGEWVNFVAPVAVANVLLNTTFGVYENAWGHKHVRTLEYSVPSELHRYIDMVQPTTRFGEVRRQSMEIMDKQNVGHSTKRSTADIMDPARVDPATVCGRTVNPDCIRALYKVPDQPGIDNKTSGCMAFVSFLDGHVIDDDLRQFTNTYFPRANGIDYSYTGLNGALSRADMQNSTSQPLEGNIDMQYLISTGYPVNVHTYNVAGRGYLVPDLDFPSPDKNSNEPYLDWLNYMLSQNDEDLPHTVSVSYSEAEQTVPQSYRQKVCEMLGQLGARGVSLIFATGDNGPGGSCQTNDGRNVTRFQPNFPATCPYVTSVGSTSGINPERASGFSSGGFSDTWQRPSYQDKAVTSYLDTLGDQWRGLYNDQGRGIPDVSAQGHLLHVINRGADKLPSGTSLSAPVFAGIIALINAQRLKAGKKTLGFLNPWIYSSAYEALNDVIDGISIGCSATSKISGLSSPFVPGAGWNATQGWDAVTGYGTPDYDKLLSLAMDLA